MPAGVAYVELYAQIWQSTAASVLRADDGFLYNNRTSLQIVQNLDYLPYGELNFTDSGVSTHKFTGDEHDSETNLEHTWFRKYSSSLGRWMTTDPAGPAAVDPSDPQTWNRYAYVRNTPLMLIDPLGLDSLPICFETEGPKICIWPGGGGDGGGGGGCRPTYFLPLDPDSLPLDDDAEAESADGCGGGGGGGRGGGGGGGFIQRIVNAACTPVADAGTIGGGVDFGAGGAVGLQDGLAINGRSGEVSIFVTGTFSGGWIGPDAYFSTGVIPNAPSNAQALNGVSTGVAVAVGRTGGNVSTNIDSSGKINLDPHQFNYQFTVGPSLLTGTFAGQISYTKVLLTVPYLGYVLHPARAVCKLATGH